MNRLEDLHERLIGRGNGASLCGLRSRRHVVAQSLPEPENAMPARRGAEEHLDDRSAFLILMQRRENLVGRRRDILDHLFEQSIVVIGEHLREPGERFLLGYQQFARQHATFGIFAAIMIGTLAYDIDIAGHGVMFADRNLSQDKWILGMGLQRRDDLADLAGKRIDFIDEDKMRQTRRLNRLQEKRKIGEPVGGRFADDDRKIDDSERRRRLLREFDRARAIDERPGFTHERAMPEPQLGGHRAG